MYLHQEVAGGASPTFLPGLSLANRVRRMHSLPGLSVASSTLPGLSLAAERGCIPRVGVEAIPTAGDSVPDACVNRLLSLWSSSPWACEPLRGGIWASQVGRRGGGRAVMPGSGALAPGSGLGACEVRSGAGGGGRRLGLNIYCPT
eukprot:scaffold22810_cov127-Isochrysis_galbana.AAC.1